MATTRIAPKRFLPFGTKLTVTNELNSSASVSHQACSMPVVQRSNIAGDWLSGGKAGKALVYVQGQGSLCIWLI